MTDLTVFTSVFNCGTLDSKLENLKQTSLAQQERLEIVLVNCSQNPKDSRDIDVFGADYAHVRVLTLPHRVPVYVAWNMGIQLARSVWVVNSNADDYVLPYAFEDMLHAGVGADVVYGNWYCTTEQGENVPYLEQVDFYPAGLSPYGNFPFSPTRLAEYCHWSCGVMWREDLHNHVGYFDPSFSICGDYDMWCRFVLGGARVVSLPTYLGYWFFDPQRGNISFADGDQFAYEVRRVKMAYHRQLMAMGEK
jgi:glycosyltransferase involved in cell wall biosynthesis